ncbi:hypothetical protein [Rhodoferax sp. GW822-FHT02A01]|uniref:hypothetical protein n=1 Tax=Rhodoferax sp. GW822-FHT02A01 TaxID=3141537 RepID=UPI00315D06BD
MIANLNISDHASGGYVVHVDNGLPGLPYASIAQAIADHEDIPSEYATHANIEYQGVRLATMAVEDIRGRGHELAAQLLAVWSQIQAEA